MIQSVKLLPLVHRCDDRGWLMEAFRLDCEPYMSVFQSNITLAYPGVIKAFHWHRQQDDLWVFPRGTAQVVLYDLREDSPTHKDTDVFYLGEANMKALLIPRGVAHGYRVLGNEPALLVYYVNQLYDPENPDEERIPYDDPLIGFDWSTRMR